jgi:hypothetical protein
MIRIKEFSHSPRIAHGFFTREGGISKGLYSSLNCSFGSNDHFKNVETNRNRVLQKLGIQNGRLITLKQIHSDKVLNVVNPWNYEDAPDGDGLVTNIPGLVLGILTADCAPVLFVDHIAKVIGAAHAGWRGALTGILESTIEEMIKLGSSASNIKAAIGPCIGLGSYEIGPEFREKFIEGDIRNEQFFTRSTRQGHYKFDLASYIQSRLSEIGVLKVYKTTYDTYQDKSLFFSYRRSVIERQKDYGRELSAISVLP